MDVLRHLRRVARFGNRYGRAAALVAYSFTLGIVSPRRRRLITRIAKAANYREGPAPALPTIAIDSITSPLTPVALPHPTSTDGNVSLMELLVIARLARERAPATAFEIGTFDGRTTATLAANAPSTSMIFTLDLPKGHRTRFELVPSERAYVDKPVSGALFHGSPHASRIRQLFGDSATFDFSTYVSDLVFIDGSHAYEYVLSDSERALAMLRNGRGLILWHDYGEWEGVTRALNKLYRSDRRFAGLRHVAATSLVILSL